MENNNTQKPAKTAELVAAAWSKIGLAMRETDMRLQAMAQKSLAKIKIPTTVAEIIEAEKLVIELRNDYTEILTERKKLTGKLDFAITHLMEPEKLIAPAVVPLTDAILKLKQQAALEENKIKWHSDEVKQIKEKMLTHISNHDAICKRKIIDLVDKAYSFALGNGDIKEEEVQQYISNVLNNTKKGQKQGRENEFKIEQPTLQFKYVSQEEIQELWDQTSVNVKEPMYYVGDLKDALDEKFMHYNIAVINKVASLKMAKEDKEAAENAISKAAAEAETANKLNSMATVHNANPVSEHKALKKVYTIDMLGENWGNATLVMTAFVANLDKCKEKLRVKNIWNTSIAQMGLALCALKNEDENFSFGALKFKIVEKL